MRNHRKTKQSSKLNSLRSARSRYKRVIVSGNTLLRLLLRGSWLAWGGVLVFLFAITAIAAFNLTHIGPMETGPTPAIISTFQKPDASQASSHRALWLLSALISASSFIAIGKYLNRSSRSRRLRSRTRRSTTTQHQEKSQHLQAEIRVSEEEIIQTDPLSVPSSPSASALDASGSESLAEMMDIRKRRSLESILHSNLL
ncbi:MAG: hypothetical protein JOZ78_00410 [Chroococcidiopsidaceae cyanobacterium CP_BM_ER_R8_30]|nr:hypothetical protein [Chroococcidiopsidaceae cyanobacterium CP_BM_ER_R8_30]